MSNKINKISLSQKAIYYGNINMPEGWEIDRNNLSGYIFQSYIRESKLIISPTLQKVTSYLREFMSIKHEIIMVEKEFTGNIYSPNETSELILDVDPVDLRNSPDYTMLYGAHVKDCSVQIYYDDNRKKNRSWNIPMFNNRFILFSSSDPYTIINNQKKGLNIIQKITYEDV